MEIYNYNVYELEISFNKFNVFFFVCLFLQ